MKAAREAMSNPGHLQPFFVTKCQFDIGQFAAAEKISEICLTCRLRARTIPMLPVRRTHEVISRSSTLRSSTVLRLRDSVQSTGRHIGPSHSAAAMLELLRPAGRLQ